MGKVENPLLPRLVQELIKKHKCHTVILYGSHAHGDATPQSDYDLMGIRKSGEKYRVAEKRHGIYLDIFVYPEKDLEEIGDEHLYMNGAKVLYEHDKFGTNFLEKLKTAMKKKYKPLPGNEIKARQVWLHKCLIVLPKAISKATTAGRGSTRHCCTSILIFVKNGTGVRKSALRGSLKMTRPPTNFLSAY